MAAQLPIGTTYAVAVSVRLSENTAPVNAATAATSIPARFMFEGLPKPSGAGAGESSGPYQADMQSALHPGAHQSTGKSTSCEWPAVGRLDHPMVLPDTPVQ